MTAPQLPEPLVPEDVDLRDFTFMPLDVVRLRDSGLVSDFEAEEALAAILLWSASWHQVPASSLPDSDKQLSKLAGYGRGVRDFLKVKEGALHRFIKCSDGLWYHPVVAEKAAEGWNGKIKEEHKRACDRQRKANKEREARKEEALPMPSHPPLLSKRDIDGIPLWRYWRSDGSQTDSSGNPSDGLRKSRLKGEGEGQGQCKGEGQGELKEKPQTGGGSTSSTGGMSRAAAIAVMLRAWEKDRGKVTKIHSAEPRVQEWATAGLTDVQLREAYDIAIAERAKDGDDGPINAGFLHVFVQKLLNPKAATGAPLVQREWHETHQGVIGKCAELGIDTKPEDDPRWLKCAIAVKVGGDHWVWIDPKNETQQRWIAELRKEAEQES